MLQAYTHQKNFDGLVVCFDMGNLKSLGSINKLIGLGLEAVELSRSMHGDFMFASPDSH